MPAVRLDCKYYSESENACRELVDYTQVSRGVCVSVDPTDIVHHRGLFSQSSLLPPIILYTAYNIIGVHTGFSQTGFRFVVGRKNT